MLLLLPATVSVTFRLVDSNDMCVLARSLSKKTNRSAFERIIHRSSPTRKQTDSTSLGLPVGSNAFGRARA